MTTAVATAVTPPQNTRRKITDDMRADFVRLYREGQSLSQIARQYGITAPSVRTHLLKQGVNLRPANNLSPLQVAVRRNARESVINTFKSDVVHDYRDGATLDVLHYRYPDLSHAEIRKILADAGVLNRVRYSPLAGLSSDMLAVYEETGSATIVAEKFTISPQTALKYVRRAGGTIHTGRNCKFGRAERLEIARQYALGATMVDLAAKYGVQSETIRNYIKSSGVELRAAGGRAKSCKIDLSTMHDIRRAYEAGESGVELAKRYNITPSTLYSYVRRAGGTVRRAGRRATTADATVA